MQQTAATTPDDRGATRYKAFISYSHAHLELARSLQDALYRFGMPWYEESGPLIFRDESGLAASPDLWEILRSALDDSEFFVYLASPEAAHSYYTRKEIEHWLDRRGSEQIIIALAKGNITWIEGDTAFDPERSDSLPEALHTAFVHTPLFVDLRALTAANHRLSDPLFRDKVATIASTLRGKSKDELYGVRATAMAVAEAKRLANEAETAIDHRLTQQALQHSAHALRLSEAQGEPRLPEAETALRRALCSSGGRPFGTLRGDTRPPYATSFDGRWLCTVHPDGEMHVWELTDEAGAEPALSCPCRAPSWVQLSSDGGWLVAVKLSSKQDPGTEIELWDLRSNEPTLVELRHEGWVCQVDVSPDGEFVLVSTGSPAGVSMWRLPKRSDVETAPSLVGQHSSMDVTDVAFSTVGSTVCGVCGNQVTVWRQGSPETVFHESSPIGKCHVSTAGDKLLMLINETPQVVRIGADGSFDRTVIHELEDDIVHRVQISPDGRWGLLISETGPSYVATLERSPPEDRPRLRRLSRVARRKPRSAPIPFFNITSENGHMKRHAFSQDGLWLATAAGPGERYPELQVGEPEFVIRLRSLLIPFRLDEIALEAHEDLVTNLTFSPDGRWLASCSIDGAVRLWDISEANEWASVLSRLLRVSDPRRLMQEFGFTFDNLVEELESALAYAQRELAAAAERLRTATPQLVFPDDARPIFCAFTDDSLQLLSAQMAPEDQRMTARLWDTRSKSVCAAPSRLSATAPVDNFDRNQTCLLSGDGRWLFVLASGDLWTTRAPDGAPLDRPALHSSAGASFKHAEFSAGGEMLLRYTGELSLARIDGPARLLDTNRTPVRDARFSKDDRWVVGKCGGDTSGDPMDVRVWDVDREDVSFLATSGSRSVRAIETSPQGRWLLVSDDAGTVVWDLRSDDRPHMQLKDALSEALWSPDEHWLVGVATDGRLLRWVLPDQACTELFPADDGGRTSLPVGWEEHRLFAAWEQHRLFVGSGNGQGSLLTMNPHGDVAERWEVPDLSGRVTGSVSRDGRWLAVWDDRAARLFGLHDRREHARVEHDPEKMHLGSKLRFSPDERWAVITRQGRLFVLDLSRELDPTPIELFGHRHQMIDFRISSDSHWLISIDLPIDEPGGFVPLQTCRIWDLWARDPASSCVTLPELDLGADRIAVTADDRWLITSSRDGIRAWPLGTEHLLEMAERVIGTAAHPSTPRPEPGRYSPDASVQRQ